ncbi:MAG: Primosomal protein N' [Planctomycetes bacterium]|nr:Primosomal protein N' [Planctomycetota bacterium]
MNAVPIETVPIESHGVNAVPARFASVCLPVPVRTAFTYSVPEGLAAGLVPGRRVRVPFGPRTMAGWYVGPADPPEPADDGRRVEAKEIVALLDDGPLLPPELVGLARWIADVYACSWGEALSACVPGGVKSETAEATVNRARLAIPADEALQMAATMLEKHPKRARVLRVLAQHADGLAVRDLEKAALCGPSPVETLAKKGLLALEKSGLGLDPFDGAEPEPPAGVSLTAEQEHALGAVTAALDRGASAGFLLHGVTGSGKTEIYLRGIRRAVDAGRQAIVLVPEIALTPQTVARFRGWFPRVAVLHSALTDAERRRQWKEIRAGRADVVIGPRSAVFAPVPRLGLVVVDEEHEPSFKQQGTPRYHAVDVAAERTRRAGAVLLLGSATPSLESRHAADEGRLALLRLRSRAGAGTMPRVEIVDMVEEAHAVRRVTLLSRRLVQLMDQAFRGGKQALLLLNRRGFASAMFCGRCGGTLRCGRCSIAMTLHRSHGSVLCHHCGDERPVPSSCPECGGPGLTRLGTGTERLEETVRAVFPAVRLARMDSDSMHDRADYERVLGAFGRGELDVILGTQMIAKGLHFPGVTVVGVVSADLGLQVPDFRASERTYQLVAQVSGRAGRAEAPGRVVVQTLQPKHPALLRAAAHDDDGFARDELAERLKVGWPPFVKLVRAVVTARTDEAARARCAEVADGVREAIPPGGGSVLGPSPCAVRKVRDRCRWHAVVKAADSAVQHAATLRLARFAHRAGGTELTIDVDPVEMT